MPRISSPAELWWRRRDDRIYFLGCASRLLDHLHVSLLTISESSSSGSFSILRKKVSETDKLSRKEQLRDKRR
jgi:hypothetical protein